MNIDFSDRKIMAAGLVLLVVAAGLGIYMVMDINVQDEEQSPTLVSGAFTIEVTDNNNLDNGEEITETTEETS
ncbi:MAG: hypothetical protein CXT77_04380 [uncultured DHVE6 group euryarchaeote]|jgi:hypothetical protein|nr:MAG: hypothetical protein CXT77_04380 [uncultured DHVE6 group euryarchaeote]